MKNFKKGFTLVEMLIVVVIIGILAAAILPRLQGAQASTRDTARKAALNQIAQGLELYNTSKGDYPQAISMASTIVAGTSISTDTLAASLVPDYMKGIPTNPTNTEVTKVKYDRVDKSSTAGNFVIVKASDGLFLVSKVERADNANYLYGMPLPTTKGGHLCKEVRVEWNQPVFPTTAPANADTICKTNTNQNFLYVLPL